MHAHYAHTLLQETVRGGGGGVFTAVTRGDNLPPDLALIQADVADVVVTGPAG